jgi:signal transduction histidine kinase
MKPIWPLLFDRDVPSSRRLALIITACFAVLGIVWVLTVDVVLYSTSEDPRLLRIQTANWGIVIVASLILYALVRRFAYRLGQARAMLSAIVNSIGDGLLVLGRDRTIVHANAAAAHMLECDVADLIGMNAETFSRRFLVSYPSGALVVPGEALFQRAFDSDGERRHKAVFHPTPSHELVVISTATGVRTRPGQRAALVVSVMHDITDAERFERLRDRLFAAAAHSLKTPIAIIKANVQFIRDTVPAAHSSSTLAVERQCNRLDRLIQNLLVVSRARSRTLQLHPCTVDIAPLVEPIVHELAEQDELAIRLELLADAEVHADPERLGIVVRNLVFESLHSATRRSPITIRLSRHSESSIELAVLYHPVHISERAYIGDEEYDDSTLSKCATETIVEAHGGQVGEDIELDNATRWVRLPTMEVR